MIVAVLFVFVAPRCRFETCSSCYPIFAYGRRGHHRGAQVYFMDKQARGRAREDMGRTAYVQIADRLDTYLVVSGDGVVITAAKRLGRLKF